MFGDSCADGENGPSERERTGNWASGSPNEIYDASVGSRNSAEDNSSQLAAPGQRNVYAFSESVRGAGSGVGRATGQLTELNKVRVVLGRYRSLSGSPCQ